MELRGAIFFVGSSHTPYRGAIFFVGSLHTAQTDVLSSVRQWRYILRIVLPCSRRQSAALRDRVSGRIGIGRRGGSVETPYSASARHLLSENMALLRHPYRCARLGACAI